MGLLYAANLTRRLPNTSHCTPRRSCSHWHLPWGASASGLVCSLLRPAIDRNFSALALLKCLRRGQLTWPSAAYVSLPQLLCAVGCGVMVTEVDARR